MEENLKPRPGAKEGFDTKRSFVPYRAGLSPALDPPLGPSATLAELKGIRMFSLEKLIQRTGGMSVEAEQQGLARSDRVALLARGLVENT